MLNPSVQMHDRYLLITPERCNYCPAETCLELHVIQGQNVPRPVPHTGSRLSGGWRSVWEPEIGECAHSAGNGGKRSTLIIHNDIPRYHQKLHVAAVRTEVVDEFGSWLQLNLCVDVIAVWQTGKISRCSKGLFMEEPGRRDSSNHHQRPHPKSAVGQHETSSFE